MKRSGILILIRAQDSSLMKSLWILPQTEEEWCLRVRAVDSTLQMSEWSSERCKVWGEALSGESSPLAACFRTAIGVVLSMRLC